MSQSTPERFSFDSSQLTSGQITGVRIALIISGIVAIIIGIIVVAQPGAVLTVVGWLFGIYFIVAGVLRLARAFTSRAESVGLRWLSGILGVLLVVGGIIILLNPSFGIGVLATIIGIAWIIEGIAALTMFAPDSSRWIGVLYGVLSIIAGVVVILLPYQAANVFLLIAAIMLIVAGVVQLVQAFLFGRRSKASPATA